MEASAVPLKGAVMDVQPLISGGVRKGAGGNAVRAQDLRGIKGVGRRGSIHLGRCPQRGILRGAKQARADLQLAAALGAGRSRAARLDRAMGIAGQKRLQLFTKKIRLHIPSASAPRKSVRRVCLQGSRTKGSESHVLD